MTTPARAKMVFIRAPGEAAKRGTKCSYGRLGLIADDVQEDFFEVALIFFDQFGDASFDLEFALVDDGDPIADGLDFAEFVGRKEHGLAFVFEALDDFAHLHAAERIEATGW